MDDLKVTQSSMDSEHKRLDDRLNAVYKAKDELVMN